MHSFLERCKPLYQVKGFRILFALCFLMGMAYSFVGPFLSMFGTIEVGMNEAVFGVFMTVNAIASIIVGTVLAHYSDTYFSRRSILLIGSVTGLLGYVGFAYVRSLFPLLLIGCLLLSVGGTTFSQVFAYAKETLAESGIPKGQDAFYMNAFRMYVALAWTVGPALASLVMIAFSFKGLFLCAALCYLPFIAAVWFFLPHKPPAHALAKKRSDSPLLGTMRRWDVIAHFSAFVLIFSAATIGMMNLPLLILKVLGGTEQNVGVTYCVAPFFELPFMLYFGLLATRHAPEKIIRVGLAIAVVYYGLLVFVKAPWQVYPLQILSAAITAVVAGLAITYFQNHMPQHPGTATNIYSNAMRIGSTLGYFLFGWVSWRFGYRAVFCMCTLFAVISLLLMQVRTRHEQAQQASGGAAA